MRSVSSRSGPTGPRRLRPAGLLLAAGLASAALAGPVPRNAPHGTVAPAAAATGAGMGTPAAPVQREGAGWRLQPQGQSLASLAQALAAASRSQLLGAVQALDAMPLPGAAPAWRAASLDAAWGLLLDGRVSHARQCDGRQCRVWLAATTPGAAALPAPAAPAVPQADPPGLFPSQ